MSQEQKKSPLVQEKPEFEHLKEKISEIKTTDTSSATKTITLIYQVGSSCGCGGGGKAAKIERVVPYDSPLNDGDEIDKLEKGDRPAPKRSK